MLESNDTGRSRQVADQQASANQRTERLRTATALIRSLLEIHGVPMPGGHGVRFPRLRLGGNGGDSICPKLNAAGTPAVRAMLVLAMLGSHDENGHTTYGKGGEKSFGTELASLFSTWFRLRVFDLDRASRTQELALLKSLTPPEQRNSMLHALKELALSAGHPLLDKTQMDAWVGKAKERLEIAYWSRGYPLPAPGLLQSDADPRWIVASEYLAKDDQTSRLVQAMYAMHIFHAELGIWQVPLDDPSTTEKFDDRAQFYQALLGLLRHSCVELSLCEAANGVAATLEALPLFTREKDLKTKKELIRLAKGLPQGFNLYVGYAAPNVEISVKHAINSVAKSRVRVLHRLAEMLADQFLDPLRMRMRRDSKSAPGFCWADVEWAGNRTRYREWKVEVPEDARAAIERSGRRLVQGRNKAGELVWKIEFPGVESFIAKRFNLEDDPRSEVEEDMRKFDAFRRNMAALYSAPMREKVQHMIGAYVPNDEGRICDPPSNGPRPCAMCVTRSFGPGCKTGDER